MLASLVIKIPKHSFQNCITFCVFNYQIFHKLGCLWLSHHILSGKSRNDTWSKTHQSLHSTLCVFNTAHGPMAVQYHLYQIETKTATARGAVPGALLPIERFVQMGQSVLPDMCSHILHKHSRTPILPATPDTNLCSIRRVEGGIGNQVPQHLSKKSCIPITVISCVNS